MGVRACTQWARLPLELNPGSGEWYWPDAGGSNPDPERIYAQTLVQLSDDEETELYLCHPEKRPDYGITSAGGQVRITDAPGALNPGTGPDVGCPCSATPTATAGMSLAGLETWLQANPGAALALGAGLILVMFGAGSPERRSRWRGSRA